jgi:hypothetical protein
MSTQSSTDFASILPEGDFIILSSDGREGEEACILIAEDGDVSFDTNPIHGGGGNTVTSDEFHRRTLSYIIASAGCGFGSENIAIDSGRLRADLAPQGALAVLIRTIICGHSVDWNGKNNVGTLDNEAQEAEAKLESAFAEGTYMVDTIVSSAYDWLTADGSPKAALESCGLSLYASDEDIARAAEKERKAVETQDIIIYDDFNDALRQCLDDVNSENRDLT